MWRNVGYILALAALAVISAGIVFVVNAPKWIEIKPTPATTKTR